MYGTVWLSGRVGTCAASLQLPKAQAAFSTLLGVEGGMLAVGIVVVQEGKLGEGAGGMLRPPTTACFAASLQCLKAT